MVKRAITDGFFDKHTSDKTACVPNGTIAKGKFYSKRRTLEGRFTACLTAETEILSFGVRDGKKLHLYYKISIKKEGAFTMSEILEIIMIVSFGASWPLNVWKSYRAKTTQGKSLAFLCLIFFGYIAGILSKFANSEYMAHFHQKWYVLCFYFLNLVMVGADLCIYARNRKLDIKNGIK